MKIELNILNYLIASLILSVQVSDDLGLGGAEVANGKLRSTPGVQISLPAEGVDGWYSVEKKPQIEDSFEEDDRAIWVLFSKNLELERILIRFPELPKYTYLENGDLKISCERGGELFQLVVSKSFPEAAELQELHYQHEDKWVHEQFVRSSHHFFHFKTIEISAETKMHADFFSSFFIEKI